jgi:hypothetical protein
MHCLLLIQVPRQLGSLASSFISGEPCSTGLMFPAALVNTVSLLTGLVCKAGTTGTWTKPG